MRIKYVVSIVVLLMSAAAMSAHEQDSIKTMSLSEVEIVKTRQHLRNINSTLHIDLVGDSLLRRGFTGNLVQSLGQIPGVHSMDIGSGFSKPMIRGMGFNRITVIENGVKQEGQQWGADHGLEIDAFNVDNVSVKKGPASLLYGSDAMGGVIEINSETPYNLENQVFGDVSLLGKSVNETLAGSLMLGIKKDQWFVKARYSHIDFGDYRVPTNSIVYLTQQIPIHGRKMKNTAGRERDLSLFGGYRQGRYSSTYAVSNVYQKVGFFPGAHGIPDASRVEDDGNDRNIDQPYSLVNHLKVSTQQKYALDNLILQWNLGWQNNHREEWSEFHTHYGKYQPVPSKDPNKELEFDKNTYSSSLLARMFSSEAWEFSAGWDAQYQRNTIGGYSFLLPHFKQFTTGASFVSTYRPSSTLTLNGGFRYDYGKIDADEYLDSYLEAYLTASGQTPEVIDRYKWRSYNVDRTFNDWSASVGLSWTPQPAHMVQVNVGRSFRLPTANELASNGMHHGAFRHEQGDPSLKSERGWQLDASYTFEQKGMYFILSPFASLFENYIYLRPTGEWSILPHAGQIYRYTGAEVFFAGAEATFHIDMLKWLHYQISGEYVYAQNRDEKRPLAYSPPASVTNTLTWRHKAYSVYGEWKYTTAQNRVAQNEAKTKSWNVLNFGATANLNFAGVETEITLSAHNVLNTKYYNHLSFYRKVEIPEQGRNFQLLIKIPFNSLLK